MVVDEKEFRSFIINLYNFTNQVKLEVKNEDIREGDLTITHNKLLNMMLKYIEMLETPKPSKFKQLKLEYDSANHK